MRLLRNVFTSVLLVVLISTSVVSADPMDPINGINGGVVTEANENVMAPNQPDNPTTNPTHDKGNLSIEEYEKSEKTRKSSQWMDTVMWALGVFCVTIPVVYLAIYSGARITPIVFAPIFHFITLRKVHVEDVSIPQIVFRTLPLITVGVLLALGYIKSLLGFVWGLVEKYIL